MTRICIKQEINRGFHLTIGESIVDVIGEIRSVDAKIFELAPCTKYYSEYQLISQVRHMERCGQFRTAKEFAS